MSFCLQETLGDRYPIIWVVLWSDKTSYDKMNRQLGHPLTVSVGTSFVYVTSCAEAAAAAASKQHHSSCTTWSNGEASPHSALRLFEHAARLWQHLLTCVHMLLFVWCSEHFF
jgi:hypothetical protein